MRPILLLSTLGLLCNCASDTQSVTVCDGKHRRPANPHGTVLPGAPTVSPTLSSSPPANRGETPGGGCGRRR